MYRAAVRDYLQDASPATAAALADAEKKGDLEFITDEIPRAVVQGLDGARRVASIVRAMKEFSHPDSAAKTETDLNKGISSTIMVARNEWKYVAEVITDFDDALPPVICYPGEVNQVILNLLVNAAHAIKDQMKDHGKGKITVSTKKRDDCVEISISDTGTGIPEEIEARVYEPFFTTKDVGKGTGQGLAFAHSVVVKKHLGKIWFETEAGCGTTFFIQLPPTQIDDQQEIR
jgi:signal transduction histidine kinase